MKGKKQRVEPEQRVEAALARGESWAEHIPDYQERGMTKRAAWHALFEVARDKGQTMQVIADTYGVTRAYVAQVLGPGTGSRVEPKIEDPVMVSLQLPPELLEMIGGQAAGLRSCLEDALTNLSEPTDHPVTPLKKYTIPRETLRAVEVLAQRSMDQDPHRRHPAATSKTIEWLLWLVYNDWDGG